MTITEMIDTVNDAQAEIVRLRSDKRVLTDALQQIGSDLGALCTIASKLDDVVALGEYAALQGIVTKALRSVR